jgi:long-chain fatty acid transport protein
MSFDLHGLSSPARRCGRMATCAFGNFRVILISGILLHSVPTLATGFFVSQQSVSGLGRVEAGAAAAAQDDSTIFQNPAGLTHLWTAREGEPLGLRNAHLSFGAVGLSYRASVSDAGSTTAGLNPPSPATSTRGRNGDDPVSPAGIPHLYAATPILNGKAFLGLAANVPFGLSAKYDRDWFGRYDVVTASLKTLNISTVAATRITDKLSLGGGLDVQRAKATLGKALADPFTPGLVTNDGYSDIRGDAWTVGYNVGLMYEVSDALQVGLHYRSRMVHGIKGRISLLLPRAPQAFERDARTNLHLPAILSAGVVYRIGGTRLYGDAGWTDWSQFDEIVVKVTGLPDAPRETRYRDTFDLGLGLEHDLPGTRTTLRCGVRYEKTPTREASRDASFPDANRVWLGVGATYAIARLWTIDFAYSHVFFEDSKISVTRIDGYPTVPPLAASSLTAATVRSRADMVAATAHFRF